MCVEKIRSSDELTPQDEKKIEREDAAYSAGEFFNDADIERHYQETIASMQKRESKRRAKSVEREQRRLGGPIRLWTFRDAKKGKRIMSKEEVVEKKEEKKEENKGKKEMKKEGKKEVKKEVKKEGKKKVAKEKKGKKERKARGPRVVDGKITVIEKENPKRKGSTAYKRYELYKKNKTVSEYLEAGGKRSSLRYDEKHGYIKLSGVKTTGDTKDKE